VSGLDEPVVLLDEIDKVGSDYPRRSVSCLCWRSWTPRRTTRSATTTLDLDLDLSDVVFLATANVIENIPSALLDPHGLVQIDGYTEDDKVAMPATLLPAAADRAARTAEEITVIGAAAWRKDRPPTPSLV